MAKGLSHRFGVVNGRITLTEGAKKAKDNIYFLMLFDTVARIYRDDFAPKLLWLIQRPTSFIDTTKPLILGRLKKVVLKYVFDIQIQSLELVPYRNVGEKKYEINIKYKYTGKDVGEPVADNAVKFV